MILDAFRLSKDDCVVGYKPRRSMLLLLLGLTLDHVSCGIVLGGK
jgi:hypothetical protein